MRKSPLYRQLTSHISLVAVATSLLLLTDSQANAQSRYGQNSSNTQNYEYYAQQPAPQYIAPKPPKKYKNIVDWVRGKRNIAYQKPTQQRAIFQQWVDWEPEYTLTPGDQLDIIVSSAPELSRTLTVGPDGRVVMPMARPIMAAGRSFTQLQAELTGELSKQLRDPTLAVTPRAYAPSQIYVGGQVNQPGTYTLPGQIGTLEALFLAGGMAPGARTQQVAVLRRAPNGGMMMRSVNIKNGLQNIREYDDNIQLRRGDIIFVPQTALAEVGIFVQAFRRTLPIDFNISYQVGQNGVGTVITP
ncbi:MAG: polysaccharide biosynthesis/export family protein [Litorimonas sp.]